MQRFPEGFLQHLSNCKGFDRNAFTEAHTKEPPVSVRINRNKPGAFPSAPEKVPWTEDGFYLADRPSFVFDPMLHAGAYYVQEASGMFVEHILKQLEISDAPVKVLDLCAAPGGKSTVLASSLNDKSLLFCNEVIRTRVSALEENMVKWGNANVVITNNDPADFASLRNYFDIILTDAPCSGSGLFRKEEHAAGEWSMENVYHCEKRQIRILEDILPSLKENGILIYTTCSYSKEENEDVVDFLISQHSMIKKEIEIPPASGIVITENGYRFYPDKLKGEGFFASVLQKKIATETSGSVHQRTKTISFETATAEEQQVIRPFIAAPDDFVYFHFREMIHAIPANLFSAMKNASGNLRIINAGTEIGRIVHNELIPAHALAMSCIWNKNIRQAALKDTASAIKYLKKEPVYTDDLLFEKEQPETGWWIVTFKSLPLGWIKIIPGRINNYYPANWRIRKQTA